MQAANNMLLIIFLLQYFFIYKKDKSSGEHIYKSFTMQFVIVLTKYYNISSK